MHFITFLFPLGFLKASNLWENSFGSFISKENHKRLSTIEVLTKKYFLLHQILFIYCFYRFFAVVHFLSYVHSAKFYMAKFPGNTRFVSLFIFFLLEWNNIGLFRKLNDKRQSVFLPDDGKLALQSYVIEVLFHILLLFSNMFIDLFCCFYTSTRFRR